MTRSLARDPMLHGVLLGLLLAAIALLFPLFSGDLGPWLHEGAVYGLMPYFAVLAAPAFVITYQLRATYAARGLRPLRFTNGLAFGGWLVGATLLWASLDHGTWLERVSACLSGAVMLVAFWLWIGSLLAVFVQAANSGPASQSQPISSRPK